MIRYTLAVLATLALFIPATASACGIEGKAVRKDGSKVNNTATISTSWNSKKAFPKDGWYTLDLGSSACGASLTVYVDGNNSKQITMPSSGNKRVDFVVP